MRAFDPTRPPVGRLARLGVIVDPGDDRSSSIARLCDRAGIDIVWWGWPTSLTSRHESLPLVAPPMDGPALAGVGPLTRARIGWISVGPGRPPGFAVESWADAPAIATTPAAPDAPMRRSETLVDLADLPQLFRRVDDVVLAAWKVVDLETAADEIRARAFESGRDPATLGVAAVLPVSIGRTEAEADARADGDPAFQDIGHPKDVGIFGTLEECQDRVIALAHAGITDLRCILPTALDIHDVIAQLTPITLGTTDVLTPGSLRSPSPPPPEGWGGRPDVPPRPRVSDGSRRR
jgi:hypothetical protein